jgi:hypothetical protein
MHPAIEYVLVKHNPNLGNGNRGPTVHSGNTPSTAIIQPKLQSQQQRPSNNVLSSPLQLNPSPTPQIGLPSTHNIGPSKTP